MQTSQVSVASAMDETDHHDAQSEERKKPR